MTMTVTHLTPSSFSLEDATEETGINFDQGDGGGDAEDGGGAPVIVVADDDLIFPMDL